MRTAAEVVKVHGDAIGIRRELHLSSKVLLDMAIESTCVNAVTGGAAGRGTPPSGRAGSAPPVQPAPIGARPSSAQRGSAATAAGAAADSPTGGGEQEFRPLSHFLQRMRPALQRPTAAAGGPQLQSRQAPRRGASPSPESAGASRLRHGDAVQMRPSSGRASVGPSAGANGPGSAEEVGGARAASVPAAAEHDGGKGTQGAQQEQQEEVPTTSGVAPAAAQEEDMPASAEAAQVSLKVGVALFL